MLTQQMEFNHPRTWTWRFIQS